MNIIINGGTKGIGKEMVKIFSAEISNKVMVTGRNKMILDQLSGEAEHGNISAHPIDLEKFDKYRESFFKDVQKNMRSIDILINNAGSLSKKDFMDIDLYEARRMMETNFWGIASMIRLLKPLMKKGSHIVNISSMGGYQGSSKFRGMSFYSASKAALSCLSECLAVEFNDSGIIVNCLALGSVQTEMFMEAFPGYKAPVNAAEMAGFIVDFAINGSRFFNGKVLPVALNTP
jgi:short-subunit dehydrogenase